MAEKKEKENTKVETVAKEIKEKAKNIMSDDKINSSELKDLMFKYVGLLIGLLVGIVLVNIPGLTIAIMKICIIIVAAGVGLFVQKKFFDKKK